MNLNAKQVQEKLYPVLGRKMLEALTDPLVTDVECNEDGQVWVETLNQGRKKYAEFDPALAYNIICTVAGLTGTTVNREKPDLKGELPLLINGEIKLLRFQGMIPPVVKNPTITIRIPSSQVFSLEEYSKNGIITPEHKDYLVDQISKKKNILVVGGTSSGKTTLCNAIIQEMSERFPLDRIITIEDTFELKCSAQNRVALRTSDQLSINDLLRCSLRMNPDRIIVGEVRGAEALSMLKSWNTGHSGICTVHANSALLGLTRIEQLIQEAGVMPVSEVIAQTINVVIYIERDKSNPKGRCVKEILDVQGFDCISNKYLTRSVENKCPDFINEEFYEIVQDGIFRRN